MTQRRALQRKINQPGNNVKRSERISVTRQSAASHIFEHPAASCHEHKDKCVCLSNYIIGCSTHIFHHIMMQVQVKEEPNVKEEPTWRRDDTSPPPPSPPPDREETFPPPRPPRQEEETSCTPPSLPPRQHKPVSSRTRSRTVAAAAALLSMVGRTSTRRTSRPSQSATIGTQTTSSCFHQSTASAQTEETGSVQTDETSTQTAHNSLFYAISVSVQTQIAQRQTARRTRGPPLPILRRRHHCPHCGRMLIRPTFRWCVIHGHQ